MAKPQLLKFQVNIGDMDDQETRRAELKKLFPSGIAEIRPRCERQEPRVESPLPEDYVRVLCTSLKVAVFRHKGTHPTTGLPNYEEQIVTVKLADEKPGKAEGPIPLEVRTDKIPELSIHMDKWDILEWFYYNTLNDHPQGYRMYQVDEKIEQHMDKEARKPGARAIETAIKRANSDAPPKPGRAGMKPPSNRPAPVIPEPIEGDYESVLAGVEADRAGVEALIEGQLAD